MRLHASILFCVLLPTAVPSIAADRIDRLFYSAGLSSTAVIPSVPANLQGSGEAFVIVETQRGAANAPTRARVSVLIINLALNQQQTLTGINIHKANLGQQGPVVAALPFAHPLTASAGAGGSVDSRATITPASLAAMGRLVEDPTRFYVSLATQQQSGGILRGQILRPREARFGAVLSSSNVVPALNVPATGQGYLRIQDTGRFAFVDFLFLSNYSGGSSVTVTGFEIRAGRPGENGPVVLNSGVTSSPSDATGRGGSVRSEVLVGNDLIAVRQVLDRPADHYFNVRTSTHQAGSLRAQLKPAESIVLNNDVAPGNLVPPAPGIGATGIAQVQFDVTRDAAGRIDSAVSYFIAALDLASAQSALNFDIHRGARGSTGPSLLSASINPASADRSAGQFQIVNSGPFGYGPANPQDLETTRGIAANPAEYYFNVRSRSLPAGFLRGQLAGPAGPSISRVES